jgi:kumamolisin
VTHVVGPDNQSIGVPVGFSGDPKFRRLVTGIASLYNFPTHIDSSHQTIGVFSGGGSDSTGKSLSNYSPSDITQYFQGQVPGYTAPPNLVPVALTVGSNQYSDDPTNPTMELTQDIMTLSTIA